MPAIIFILLFLSNNLFSQRIADHKIEKIFLKRQSSSEFTPPAYANQISKETLNTLFEAARWAPSSFNNQPWKFLYTTWQSPNWEKFFNLLNPFNKSWAKNAQLLIVVLSDKNNCKAKHSCKQSFDTGAAVQNLALQAGALGLSAHVIEGFDSMKARKIFNVPKNYNIEVMVAIGVSEKPTGNKPRKKIAEFVFFENLP